MKVKELISKLNKFDGEAEIITYYENDMNETTINGIAEIVDIQLFYGIPFRNNEHKASIKITGDQKDSKYVFLTLEYDL